MIMKEKLEKVINKVIPSAYPFIKKINIRIHMIQEDDGNFSEVLVVNYIVRRSANSGDISELVGETESLFNMLNPAPNQKVDVVVTQSKKK